VVKGQFLSTHKPNVIKKGLTSILQKIAAFFLEASNKAILSVPSSLFYLPAELPMMKKKRISYFGRIHI
jgi:hypothetical protein